MSNQMSSSVYKVRIERTNNSTKPGVIDTLDVNSVNRSSIPMALEKWICRHGIANGDELSISIDIP